VRTLKAVLLHLVIQESLLDAFPRRRNERSVLHDVLLQRLAGDEDEPRLVARRFEPDAVFRVRVGEDGRVVLFDGPERACRVEGANEGLAFEGVDLQAVRQSAHAPRVYREHVDVRKRSNQRAVAGRPARPSLRR
jgi:hypothetical protein